MASVSQVSLHEMKVLRQGPSTSPSDGAGAAKTACSNHIRVLVVDEHPVVRWGLRSFLAGYNHIVVVGEAGNGRDAIAQTKALSPHVVLMEIAMPKLDGLAATKLLRKGNPKVKVLIFSMQKDSSIVKQAIQAGARGYLSKEASPAKLAQAIEAVGAGDGFFSWGDSQAVFNQKVKSYKDTSARKRFSARQREVLVAIAEGLSHKKVASLLGMSERTVETHLKRIKSKFKIHTVAGLTRFAITQGLISLPNADARTTELISRRRQPS